MIQITDAQNNLIAIIIPADYKADSIRFFTPNNFSQQLGYMHHPAGHKIQPHYHNLIVREIKFTQEVLFIRNGKVRVDFFDTNQNYIGSYILKTGDVILLASGGHGFEILEETEMIEVKQGPYIGDQDKTRFQAQIKEIKLLNNE